MIPDWSSSFTALEQHQAKAEKELVLVNAGLTDVLRNGVLDKAEARVNEMLNSVLDAKAWIRAQR